MGNRLTKIYTRTGDRGNTVLGDGSRINKSSLRVEAMGDVDELNSLLGLLLAEDLPADMPGPLLEIQHDLFDIGGELSIPGSNIIEQRNVAGLERMIDGYNSALPPLKEFILPGGSRPAAACHLARAVCRRAERRVVELGQSESVNQYSQSYLNRLSDLLFVFARVLAREGGGTEVYWNRERSRKQ